LNTKDDKRETKTKERERETDRERERKEEKRNGGMDGGNESQELGVEREEEVRRCSSLKKQKTLGGSTLEGGTIDLERITQY